MLPRDLLLTEKVIEALLDAFLALSCDCLYVGTQHLRHTASTMKNRMPIKVIMKSAMGKKARSAFFVSMMRKLNVFLDSELPCSSTR